MENNILKVIKRNGDIVDFNDRKIKAAIEKAMNACKTKVSKELLDEITSEIVQDILKLEKEKVNVEDIQDVVERNLIKKNLAEEAKSYILYRENHKRIRDASKTVLNYQKLVDDYLDVNDWRVKENSTVGYSLGGLILSNSGAITANYWLSEVYDKEIEEAQRNADIHIHDLGMLSGYCFTGDTKVRMADGRDCSFAEMVANGMKEVSVYAYDLTEEKIVKAKAVNPRKTRTVEEIAVITLNNFEKVKCTTDHRFLLINKEYKMAKDLEFGDVLMSLKERREVIDVEIIKERTDVYDITVPNFENFALSNGVFVHNCAGWSLKQLIQEGLGGVTGKITSKPANHLSTLCNQIVNFLGIMQNEWAGAQALSSFDTYLAPFVKKDNLSYEETKQCIQSLVFGLNVSSRWGCLPAGTRVLTPSGWKRRDELNIGDVIYTWVDGTLKQAPVKHIIEKKNEYGVLHKYSGVSYRQIVTPEHRCIVDHGDHLYGIHRSEDIFHKREKIQFPTYIDNIDFPQEKEMLKNEEVELAAICYARNINGNQCLEIINPEEKDDGTIKRVLESLDLEYQKHEYIQDGTKIYKYILSKIHKEYIIGLIGQSIDEKYMHLSPMQSKLFVDTLAKFAGCHQTTLSCEYDNDEREKLELIMIKAGYIPTKQEETENSVHYISVESRKSVEILQQEEIPYDGIVWCPNTDDGTAIYKDEDGYIFISGNCQAPFTNVTLDWTVPNDLSELPCIVGGKEMPFKYKDCKKEMDMINKAFIEVMIEGDANGRGFQYPMNFVA